MPLARDVFFRYMRHLNIRHFFGVPGTNEIPLIDGASIPQNEVTYVPCLHEGVAVAAAMGYGRMTGVPGVALVHVTPGAGNIVSNLFNAARSHMPVVVLCGQQDSDLLIQEPLLASDLVEVVRQYTKWSYELRTAHELSMALQRAFKVAMAPPAGPVFLSIPWNLLLEDVPDPVVPGVTRIASRFRGDADAIAAAAERLAAAENPLIVAGDGVGASGAWDELRRLATVLGAKVYSEFLGSYMNCPNDLPQWKGELPGSQADLQDTFANHDVAFFIGFNSQAPTVAYNHDLGPNIPPSVRQLYLHDDLWEIGKNHYGEVAIFGDIKTTLAPLCDAIEASPRYRADLTAARNRTLQQQYQEKRARPVTPRGDGKIAGADVARALAALQKELAAPLVFVDEAIWDSPDFVEALHFDTPSAYVNSEGGSLGYSMGAALGIELAARGGRTVVNAIGDGSTLFSPQAWWTAAKFGIPVLFLIINNREYKTLKDGLAQVERLYEWQPSGTAWYLDLQEPPLDFVQLARSFGVEGARVTEAAELPESLRKALAVVQSGSPFVLEIWTDRELSKSGATQPRRLRAIP